MHSRLANGIHQDSTSATESCRRSETSVHRSVEFLHEPLEYDFSSMSSTSCFNIGVISGLVYTVKTTGFLSLHNGLGVTLVGSIPKGSHSSRDHRLLSPTLSPDATAAGSSRTAPARP